VAVQIGSPVASEIVAPQDPPGDPRYFWVLIPDGVASVSFELTGATSDLNLYVGYPDLETVQNGGLWFWYSEEVDAQDEIVIVEPGTSDFVNAGLYYVEVRAEDFRASSPFTLTVRIP
jgi:hypothetical protein